MKQTKYDVQFDTALKNFPDIPKIVVLTIAQNESGMNHECKPYFEKTWRYFTTDRGEPLKIEEKTATEVQRKAIDILGEAEFGFQVRAWGICQTVGSVLRELGYYEKKAPTDAYTQIFYACKHLNGMIQRFKKKYGKMPTHEQMFAMYNGGFGAVIAGDKTATWVQGYIDRAIKNRQQFLDINNVA